MEYKVIEREELESMPYDKNFYVEGEDGIERLENCHATGYEVILEGDNTWWNEYVDSNGDLHYGR